MKKIHSLLQIVLTGLVIIMLCKGNPTALQISLPMVFACIM